MSNLRSDSSTYSSSSKGEESPPRTAGRGYFLFESTVLILLLFAIGTIQVPSHWTSIWADIEFSGWVAPVANRLSDNVILYGDNGHSPMPPLPSVLIYYVSGGHATWYTESFLNCLFQGLILLVMFLGLGRLLPQPIPFLATLCSVPIFFALKKAIFYDSLVQFWVAILAILVGRLVASQGRRRWLLLGAIGAATALTILSKQSTAAGAFLGVLLSLAFIVDSSTRLLDCLIYVGASAALTICVGLLLIRHVSLTGMLYDVFLTSAEPKGGSIQLVYNAVRYVLEITVAFLPVGLSLLAGVAALNLRPRQQDLPSSLSVLAVIRGNWLLYCAGLIPVLAFAILGKGLSSMFLHLSDSLLWIGLFAYGLWMVRYARQRTEAQATLRPLFAMFCVLFCSAFFHSMSVPSFRWTYDNNPLIVLSWSGLLLVSWNGLEGANRLPKFVTFLAIVLLSSFVAWQEYSSQYILCASCTESWPECNYLRGARLRPASEGMRKLVSTVRSLAVNPSDEVLLLPDDPNAGAWFERPRPRLSSQMVFVDQYWDRYVEEDLSRLDRNPPKVIVIGPRTFSPAFQQIWRASTTHRGCERLIDLINDQLLPGRYRKWGSQAIDYHGLEDFMDIYVRKD